ncbi:MAG: hypothetical protein OEZ02_15410, partial [Anaerolineae bacterium]|nr:hypothetical protein [Anaerolineae bacterium]
MAIFSSTKDLLKALLSEDANVRGEAIKHTKQLKASSAEIVRELEMIALEDRSKKNREAAIMALLSGAHRSIQRNSCDVPPAGRSLIIKEIARWTAAGIINLEQSQILTQRYDFTAARETLEEETKATVKPVEAARTPAVSQGVKATPVRKRSLSEILLSEATIKVALYMGAFLLIATAFFIAALYEQWRIPILAVMTGIFLAGSAYSKSKLKQVSVVLFIIFS